MNNYDHSWKISKPYANVEHFNKGDEYEYRTGNYYFKNGVVEIYNEPKNLTRLSLIYNGREYYRLIEHLNKEYTDIGLKRIAGKFAKEITEN